MATTLCPLLKSKYFDNNGAPLANGTLSTFQAGTNTPVATYKDSTGVTPNTNPIVLNARGECDCWLVPNVAYKFLLKDSQSNQIWSEDNVVNSALISLFGGVDTGTANAYVLNFTANFTALTNGIVIYFVAANNNNGNSTVNVNGLGVVPILNPNGAVLTPNMIVGGGIIGIIYYNGDWYLIESPYTVPQSGSFNLTVAGFSAPSPVACEYTVIGDTCMVRVAPFSFLSSAATFTGTVSLAAIKPGAQQYIAILAAQDNGANIYSQVGLVIPGAGSTVNFTFYKNGSASGWTASGAKGLSESAGATYLTFTYKLST